MDRTSFDRRVLAALLLVAGGVHVPLVPEHLEEAPYVGVLFVLLALACLGLAVAVLRTEDRRVWLLSGVVCVLAALAFVLSRTVGLPQIGDDVGNWADPLGVVALVSELLVALLAALHLRAPTTSRPA
ncbi:hypothetical protein [Phycicoccus flavus]|uniref:hypothetical protein n=1 Tax=Phycicoccus flavus TaxID=2502783 RepID=UPI000FEB8FC1|nr:hypothetical protein [Phycicoccus flavus]NHA67930.1 hypothetical protein [Phycicoccus flavus]